MRPQQAKDGPCAHLPAQGCSPRRLESLHSAGCWICSSAFQNIFSLSAWEEQLSTPLPFISLSSGGPVLLPRHRRETGRCCLGQTALGHPCPGRTHGKGLVTPGRWDRRQNQRVFLHIWPIWLISVLAYHENHYKELQRYDWLSLPRWWYTQPRPSVVTPHPGGSRGRNPWG